MFLSRLRALSVVVTLVALGTPLFVPHLAAPARADAGTTVTGNWHRWDPLANNHKGAYDTASTPSVSVEQTTNLVDQVVRVSWSGFTPTSNEFGYAHAPAPGATASSNIVWYPVEVLECSSSVPTTNPLSRPEVTGCYPATVDSPVDGGHGQNNAIRTVTQPDGTGYADLHVENGLTNDLLGCDQTHDCTIVVVPNNGGEQPSAGSNGPTRCDSHKQDVVGPPSYIQDGTAGLDYLGGACAWADRIEVPIHFAPLPSDCPNVDPAFQAIGSPLLRRGLGQLQAGWCRGTNAVNFSYNSTSSEYQARALFGGSADIALVTRPADPAPTHVAYAPIANTAISIAYYVDNVKTGLPMTDLRLTPRLVAKLLTQSYQPFLFNCQSATDKTKASNGCAPEVAGNPVSILDDPEFQELNFRGDHPDRSYFPGRASLGSQDQTGGFFATVVSGDTDLTYELTRWIAADKDALAFLQGQPDRWGMKINPNYRPASGVLYPTSQFQPLDPGWTPDKTDTEHHLLEGFQGTWNPLTGLDNVAATLVGNRSSGVDTTRGQCSASNINECRKNPSLPINFPRLAAEPLGSRDLWAVVDNTSAQAFRFPTAELVNAKGVAVAPTEQSMSAALGAMATNPDHVTQFVDHAHETSGGYPLTEPVYAMVQTCGVASGKVAAIRSFLTHVAASQTYGRTPGTLTPGLLALSPAQLARTKAAAAAVSSASCTTPRTVTPSSSAAPHAAHGGSGGGGGAGSSGTGAGSGAGTAAAAAGVEARSTARPSPARTSPSTTTPAAASATQVRAKDVGYKAPDQSGTMSMALPILLIVGAGFLVGAPLVWLLTATTAGAALASRLAFWR